MTDRAERARDGAAVIAGWLRLAAAEVHEQRRWLTELDAAIGDGDHGINLDRGLQAVVADLDAWPPPDDPGALLLATGRRLLGLVGGASGALYGRGLMTAGERVRAAGHRAAGDGRMLVLLVLAGTIEGITALGRAVAGDKTMLDALAPALEAARAGSPGEPLAETARRVADAAGAGAMATVPLVARKGRASYLGERSAGHMDPGAASSAILVRCLTEAILATPAARD